MDICLKPRLKPLGVKVIKCFPLPLLKNMSNKYAVLFYDQREVVADTSRKETASREQASDVPFSCPKKLWKIRSRKDGFRGPLLLKSENGDIHKPKFPITKYIAPQAL